MLLPSILGKGVFGEAVEGIGASPFRSHPCSLRSEETWPVRKASHVLEKAEMNKQVYLGRNNSGSKISKE